MESGGLGGWVGGWGGGGGGGRGGVVVGGVSDYWWL
jgi:hypothetical protein